VNHVVLVGTKNKTLQACCFGILVWVFCLSHAADDADLPWIGSSITDF